MENMSPHSTATQLFKYLKIVMIIITKALIVSWVAVLYQIFYVCKWMERMSFSWTLQETSNRCVCKGNLIAPEMGSQWWDSEISKATLWTEIRLLWRMDSLHEWISVSRTPGLIFFKLRIRTGRGWLVLIEEGKGMWRLCPDCCFCSVTQPYLTLCDPMDCSTPGFPVLHYLPDFAQTHVHWIDDTIQPSHPLSSPSPLALIFPSIRIFSNESALHGRWPKYWRFSFSISPSNEY